MIFMEATIAGAFLITPEPHHDERGFFARTFCRDEFAAHNLVSEFIQHSVALNHSTGTIRGIHLQKHPHEETKLVRCIRGRIFDVVVDLRLNSKTYGKWESFLLSDKTLGSIYIPKGCAHGYQTLDDNCLVEYLIDTSYVAGLGDGIRYDDVALGITWPRAPTVISTRDLGYAPLTLFK